ncbi:MAG: M28 family peptidase [Trueperaceae bacterium]|nr:M28 family peptidase [Trueperaceae bacterium]
MAAELTSLEAKLFDDVRALATPRGRVVETPGHEAARDYLLGRMAEVGLEPYSPPHYALPYHHNRLVNLAGVLPGTNPDRPPVALVAHYDAVRGSPGADDNAAALAISLAVAERLRDAELDRPLLLLFPDAEEPPHFLGGTMGSSHFYHHQRHTPIHAAVVLDLVGHDVPIEKRGDLLFITGAESDPNLPNVLGDLSPNDLRPVAVLNRYVGDLSDHHVFRVNQRPYLFLTCGRWAHYHQPTDTPDKLSGAKMTAVVDYLVRLLPKLAETRLDGPFEGYDSTPFELQTLREHLGDVADRLGLSLNSRADIDRVAIAVATRFGLH